MTAIALGLAAWPLWRISRSNAAPSDLGNSSTPIVTAPAAVSLVPFQLQLSAAARHIELRDENAEILWQVEDSQNTEFMAELKRLPSQISMKISWSGTPAPRHFAKLRIDALERETLIHVFDARGDIDDLWELP